MRRMPGGSGTGRAPGTGRAQPLGDPGRDRSGILGMSLLHTGCRVTVPTGRFIASFCLCISLVPALQAQRGGTDTSAVPLSVRDVLELREFGDRQQLAVTPDFHFVAFVLRDP